MEANENDFVLIILELRRYNYLVKVTNYVVGYTLLGFATGCI